ncbi:hypothetical protein DENSPDRAFT_434718 [Dentipellis sp. KUC8613]|nr:hypothetical protein DENSPDRAFT_434718 [Dentipellis sp. KUC8613]
MWRGRMRRVAGAYASCGRCDRRTHVNWRSDTSCHTPDMVCCSVTVYGVLSSSLLCSANVSSVFVSRFASELMP